MKRVIPFLTAVLIAWPAACPAAGGLLTVKAVNKLALARASQTIELSATNFPALNGRDLTTIHVSDANGKELLAQAVDTDYDDLHKPDMLIFQADFAPNEAKTFTLTAGAKQHYKPDDFKAYGRFVRERFDDFAWENDRIAHRTYGKALETWKGEPLTSSAIDIWSKRTPHMVIDEWYMVDNYHADEGTGLDDYSAGATCGDGGDGIMTGDKLVMAKNFVDSRVLANGPIRVMFELVYDEFDVNGAKYSEVRRISLDAGSQLDHYQIFYKAPAQFAGELPNVAVGLKKVAREQKELNAAQGTLTIWEPMEANLGMQGVAAIVNPKDLVMPEEDQRNNLLLARMATDRPFSYWAGFAWDRAGIITTQQAWKKYVDEFAQGVASPIEVSAVAQ